MGLDIMIRPQMDQSEDDRLKQVLTGAGFLLLIGAILSGILVGWRYLPGILGEAMGTLIGIITTPFLMEISLAFMGLMIVIGLNIRHRMKEGDDFVYLEQVDGPDSPTDLPDQAQWVLYRNKPLDGQSPSLIEQVEGALAIGDYSNASECIGEMDPTELKRPETLAVRLALAKATGKHELAEELEKEICKASGNS